MMFLKIYFLVKILVFFFQLCGGMFFTKCYAVKQGISPNVTLFVMYNHNNEYNKN